jgi:hypothetical protein
VNEVMNLRVPQNAGKLSSDLTTGGECECSSEVLRAVLVKYFVRVF